MPRTCLVRRHILDVCILERLEENDDFADVPFELADVVAHFLDILERLAECTHGRRLTQSTTFTHIS